MDELTIEGLLFAGVCIALGGLAKGLVGLGMPLVALPLLTYLMPVRDAVCMMALPMVVTNIYQMVEAGNVRATIRRFWPLLVTLAVGIPLGAYFLTSLDSPVIRVILGLLVILFAISGLLDVKTAISPGHEKSLAPVTGLIAGILGGIAGLWGPPLGVYLVALRLPKERFIGAIGTAFSVGAISLLLSLVAYGAFRMEELTYSTLSLVPAFAGLLLGQWGRTSIPQERFRKLLLLTLVITGLALVYRAVVQ
jgi:uncharacterized membrane protein YfcA